MQKKRTRKKIKLFVSFSGGKTSAYMAKRLIEEYSYRFEMRFGFANTGQENEETLLFVERCATAWKIPIVWLEAVVHHEERKGSTHRIVDFTTASRKGEPFEEIIKKYGIPNKMYPHCTRELKLNPINSYLASIGWDKCITAVGIRSDEPLRLRKNAKEKRIIYPLAHLFPTDKATINDWWEEQPFNLGLLEHQGNCTWCWKKTLSKHVRIIKESPEVYDFPARMEATYGTYADGKQRTFFRENRSTKDLISVAELLNLAQRIDDPDADAGCSESCEAFG